MGGSVHEQKLRGAYVGMHPLTGIPLGTLATAEIRTARKAAKDVFNPLWHGRMSRTEAYTKLAAALNIPVGECHFGWFDVDQCNAAIAAIKEGRVA